jgi:hypothetical protein
VNSSDDEEIDVILDLDSDEWEIIASPFHRKETSRSINSGLSNLKKGRFLISGTLDVIVIPDSILHD